MTTSNPQCPEEKSISLTDIKLRCQDIEGHLGSHVFPGIGVLETVKRFFK